MIDLDDVQPVQKRVMGFEGNSWEEVRVDKKECRCDAPPVFSQPQN